MKLEFGRLINVTGDDYWREKYGGRGGGFCRLILLNNTFYAFISNRGGYYVRGFNENWKFTGFEKRLTPEGVREIDQDITSDGEYIYHFPMLPHAGQMRKFDAECNLVKQTAVFNATPNDIILDQNIASINGKIYVGSEYRETGEVAWGMNRSGMQKGMQNIPPNSEVARATHIRIYDTDLNLLKEKDLIANIEGAAAPRQYWGLGASQLYANGYHCVVAASSIGNTSYFDQAESVGARQIFVIRFDDDFNFVDSKGPLTDTNNDNYWCTGSWYEDGRYYISYTCRKPGEGCVPGPPGPGERPPRPRPDRQEMPRPRGTTQGSEIPRRQRPQRPRTIRGEPGTFGEDHGNIRLGIFDENFNELETVDITSLSVNPKKVTGAAHRSKILKIGNKLYVSYDHNGGWIQELILKK